MVFSGFLLFFMNDYGGGILYFNEQSSLSPQMNIQKTTTYDFGNPTPDLGQTQKCGRVKLVNGIR
jgi:hypothetical protein